MATDAWRRRPAPPRSAPEEGSAGDGHRRRAGRDASRPRAGQRSWAGPPGTNPRVGAVLLGPDGRVVAEGWHRGAGTPHAEAVALAEASGQARGATAVVTLEPCDHVGRTGPCTQALVDAGVARVVFAATDPNPVAGGGAATPARGRCRGRGGSARRGRRAAQPGLGVRGRPWAPVRDLEVRRQPRRPGRRRRRVQPMDHLGRRPP